MASPAFPGSSIGMKLQTEDDNNGKSTNLSPTHRSILTRIFREDEADYVARRKNIKRYKRMQKILV
jgi:hypothetical protein